MKSIALLVFFAICSSALSQKITYGGVLNFAKDHSIDYDLATDAEITDYLNKIIAEDSEFQASLAELNDEEGKYQLDILEF